MHTSRGLMQRDASSIDLPERPWARGVEFVDRSIRLVKEVRWAGFGGEEYVLEEARGR